MSIDMPPGCSFASLKPPAMKLESLRTRLSNLQSTLSSGWEALRNVRVVPRLPANSSFSRHSLAYVHASTQYIKQVSGLLKIGVNSLRNSSSYEVVQGILTMQSSSVNICLYSFLTLGSFGVWFQKLTHVYWDWKVQLKMTQLKCNLDLVKHMFCKYFCLIWCHELFYHFLWLT